MTGPLVLYGGVTNTDPTQLVAPSIAVTPTSVLATTTLTVTIGAPASWPGGVTVQLQTQRDAGAWVNATQTPTGAALPFTREATSYTINVRGYAINGGALTDSGYSGVASLTITPYLTAVVAGGTPLTWRLRANPTKAEASADAIPQSSPAITLRNLSPNRIVVDRIEDPEIAVRVTPTAVAWQALTSTGVSLGTGSFTLATDWRASLIASADLRVLVITVTAPDASVSTVKYPVTFAPAT